jgi:hypothetical protein
MSLLSPWGLWWLLSVPLLVTFYLFRPEPRRRMSSSFFLWRRSQPETQGGVYAKRLRDNPLLWLQVLVLILLSLYLSRPASSWSSLLPSSERVVLVLDRSASMQAGGAFEQAVMKAEAAIDGLFGFANFGSQPEVMLIAVDREPQILVPFSKDAQPLREALATLRPTEVTDQLPGLRVFLASLISDQKATVWLFSDHLPPELELPGLQYTACGKEPRGNVGLVAFSVEMSQDGTSPRPFAYVRVENFSASAEQRMLRVEKMTFEKPDRVEAVLLETSLLLPAGGGETLHELFPAARLSSSQPSLFRARLLPLPGTATPEDGFPIDDAAYSVSPPYGQLRIRVAVTPELKASFLLRALAASNELELLDWEKLLQQSDAPPLDLLICPSQTRLPTRPVVRTRFEVTETPPLPEAPVEVLRAVPDAPLVTDAGALWSSLRVQREAAWKVEPDEQVLLSTASGPALTLKGLEAGQPTLCWRFPLGYSSLPLSPAFPVVVSRFVAEYSRPTSTALTGSITTSQRLTRPAGAPWKGQLELHPLLSSPWARPLVLQEGERQLPRLSYSGFYQASRGGRQDGPGPVMAVNLFSSAESALPHTPGDLSFARLEGAEGRPEGQQKKQYRETTTPLASLALLLLVLETAIFLRRGRP